MHTLARRPARCRAALGSGGAVPARMRLSTRRVHDGGQAFVEFALVLPVLLLVLVGIFKCGVLYNNYIQLTNAVDAGARQFSVERGQASPCIDAAAAADDVSAGLSSSSLTLTMTESETSSAYVYPAATGTCPTLVAGDASTVTGSYPCDLSILGINFFPGCTLTSSATEIVQ